nr:trihelix transcription factor ASR3 [Ipomoea batatas]
MQMALSMIFTLFLWVSLASKKQRRRSNTRKRRAEESLQSWRYALSGSVKQEQPSSGEKVEPPTIQHSAMEIEGEPSGLGDKEIEGEPSGLGDKVEEPPENKEGDNIMAEPSAGEDKQEMLALTLQKNAELINAVLEGNFAEDGDDDMMNSVPDPTDLARLQADKLIKYLGKISETLGELCEIVQECFSRSRSAPYVCRSGAPRLASCRLRSSSTSISAALRSPASSSTVAGCLACCSVTRLLLLR